MDRNMTRCELWIRFKRPNLTKYICAKKHKNKKPCKNKDRGRDALKPTVDMAAAPSRPSRVSFPAFFRGSGTFWNNGVLEGVPEAPDAAGPADPIKLLFLGERKRVLASGMWPLGGAERASARQQPVSHYTAVPRAS